MRGKTGIVDVGGGMRGVYAAGVFDRCMARLYEIGYRDGGKIIPFLAGET